MDLRRVHQFQPWVRREVRFADYISDADIGALADLASEELRTKRAHGGHMFSDWNRFEIGPRRMRVDFRNRMSKISCPVLFVHGELDERFSPISAAWMVGYARGTARIRGREGYAEVVVASPLYVEDVDPPEADAFGSR